MDITFDTGKPETHPTETLILALHQITAPPLHLQAIDKTINGAIAQLLENGDFTGKLGQTALLYTPRSHPARRILLTGLGKPGDLTPEQLRRAAAAAINKITRTKTRSAAFALEPDLNAAQISAIVEGSLLAAYRYQGQRNKTPDIVPPESLTLLLDDSDDQPDIEQAIATGKAIAESVQITRDLVNLPPNICTPAYMAHIAKKAAQTAGLRFEALEREQIAALQMGALLAVAQGSDTPPRFIILEYNSDRAEELNTLILVGKGVTFDTGGYTLKPQVGMRTMKGDMAGGAAIIGTMHAIGLLDLPLHVVGLIPAADNMINGHAYRPQDVVTASNGVTIEINSTDAEGRMLLADALVYAQKYNPAAVIDIATLTGACMIALGGQAAGLFSTDDHLRDTLLAAAQATHERLWPLPLYDEYQKTIESQTADTKNSSNDRTAGVGSSASFLKQFTSYPAWAHIDMAGMEANASYSKKIPYIPEKGASGYGVRLLTQLARQWAT